MGKSLLKPMYEKASDLRMNWLNSADSSEHPLWKKAPPYAICSARTRNKAGKKTNLVNTFPRDKLGDANP